MPEIVFVEADGAQHRLACEVGTSLMESARNAGLPGIEAECGGSCACATCHIYIRDEWLKVVGTAGEEEAALLEFADEPRTGSRLSCQILVDPAMDGMVVDLPSSQGF